MAKFHGKNGALYVDIAGGGTPSPVLNLNKWTFDRTTAKVDVTAMGDTNINYVSGLPDAKGTVAGFLDDVNQQLYTAASDGVARGFYLYAKAPGLTPYWYGTALFDQSASGGTTQAADVTGNWVAAGPILRAG